jgi:ABC-type oligopeptide transport system ATPase subunit
VNHKRDILLDVKSLTVAYATPAGLLGFRKRAVRVLEQLDLQIYRGETLGVVGESGSGKSTLGNAIMGLVPAAAGQVRFGDRDVLRLNGRERRRLGRHMQIVFQNPHAAMNPRLSIMDAVAEPLQTHTDMGRAEREARVLELLEEVGLGAEQMRRRPHQLSGGQAQRVVIARALALNPDFLVLDEPTSALDVSVQAQILNLLTHLQQTYNLTYMFISHDLSVLQHVSDRIAVMYLGEIVELASTQDLFHRPQHSYTQTLLAATPLPHSEPGLFCF